MVLRGNQGGAGPLFRDPRVGGVKPEGLKISSIFRPRAKFFGSFA